MNPGFVIAVAAVILIFVLLIFLLFQPIVRVGYWVQNAVRALEDRDFESAEKYYQRVAQLRPKLRNPEQRASIEFLERLGLGFCAQRRSEFATAENHFSRAVELLDQGVKQEPSVIANVLTELAVACHAQGKTSASEQALQRLKKVCDSAHESELPQIAELMIAAANGAAHRNFKDLAFHIAKMAQNALETTVAWRDGSLAHTQIALASFHMLYCECNAARELIETALKLAGEELDRRDAATAYSNFGWIFTLSAQTEAAIEAFERCLEIDSADFGADHWRTSIAISSLAVVYRVRGEYHKAREYYDRAWRIQTEQLPEDDTVRARSGLTRALILIEFGEFEEADRLLADAARIADVGALRAVSSAVQLVQGLSALTKGHDRIAHDLLQDARAIAVEVYGSGHRMTCEYLAFLGSSLIRLKRYEEAEELLSEALAIRESLTDGSVIDLADLLGILAELYLATDRIADAESAILRAQQTIDGRVAETHLILADLNETLGRIRHAQGEFETALEHFQQALDLRDKLQPPDHPRRIRLLDACANSLASSGETAQATEQRTQAQAIRKKYPEPELSVT